MSKVYEIKKYQRFNYLTVIEIFPTKRVFSKEGVERSKKEILCKCDCGNNVITIAYMLVKNHTKSCGCLRKKRAKEIKSIHGLSRSLEYKIWHSMKMRCTNDKVKAYKYYGGRGISVCERWMKFENFISDMGLRPTTKHSIDRYPNKDGNYEPGNCRWATSSEQSENRNKIGYLKLLIK